MTIAASNPGTFLMNESTVVVRSPWYPVSPMQDICPRYVSGVTLDRVLTEATIGVRAANGWQKVPNVRQPAMTTLVGGLGDRPNPGDGGSPPGRYVAPPKVECAFDSIVLAFGRVCAIR